MDSAEMIWFAQCLVPPILSRPRPERVEPHRV